MTMCGGAVVDKITRIRMRKPKFVARNALCSGASLREPEIMSRYQSLHIVVIYV